MLGNCWTNFIGSAQVDVGVSDDKDKMILQIVFSSTSPIYQYQKIFLTKNGFQDP